MAIYNSPTFGALDIKQKNTTYDGHIAWAGKKVPAKLCLDRQGNVEIKTLEQIDRFIQNFERYENALRAALQDDFEKDAFAADFVELHIDELDDEGLEALIEGTDENLEDEERVFSLLHLVEVHFYPEAGYDNLAIFDYQIDSGLRADILVVSLKKDGSIFIIIES